VKVIVGWRGTSVRVAVGVRVTVCVAVAVGVSVGVRVWVGPAVGVKVGLAAAGGTEPLNNWTSSILPKNWARVPVKSGAQPRARKYGVMEALLIAEAD